MSVIVKKAETQLVSVVEKAMKQAMEKGELPPAELLPIKTEIPADRKNGDYSTNAAMAHARVFRSAPVKIAQSIMNNLDLSDTYFEKCECAGAGFLNFTLSGKT